MSENEIFVEDTRNVGLGHRSAQSPREQKGEQKNVAVATRGHVALGRSEPGAIPYFSSRRWRVDIDKVEQWLLNNGSSTPCPTVIVSSHDVATTEHTTGEFVETL